MPSVKIINKKTNFKWIDIFNPTPNELIELKNEYEIPKDWIENCLLPNHLPLLEGESSPKFLVFRVYDEKNSHEDCSIQGLTRKIIFFITDHFMITIHRVDLEILEKMRSEWLLKSEKLTKEKCLFELLSISLETYTKPLNELSSKISDFEDRVFSDHSTKIISKNLFLLKRENAVLKRILRMTHDLLIKSSDKIGLSGSSIAFIKERAQSLFSSADEIDESIESLMNQIFTMDSQKTNDSMKTITFYTALFMPINLITGLFGMNFEWMPLLKHPNGFWICLMTMGVLFLLLFVVFFKKNRELK